MERVIPGHGHPAIRLSNSNGALRRINGGSKHDSLKVEGSERVMPGRGHPTV